MTSTAGTRTRPRRIARRLAAATVSALVITACGGGRATTTATSTTRPAAPAPQTSATALQSQYVAVVHAAQPPVVQIQTDRGLGSGVVLDAGGHIVTNEHVVAGATALAVTLSDGRRFAARLVGADAADDLAVITIGSGHGVTPAHFGDSSRLEVGDIVLAVGNPLGLQSSVTDGIISALGRDITEGQGVVLPNAIQTSAPINPGNSGGALVDLQGQVIGIPTLVAASSVGGAAAGIGFAIPSNTVTDIAAQLVRDEHVTSAHPAALELTPADGAEPTRLTP